MNTGKNSTKQGSNHRADIRNKNPGTNGTNITYDKAQGNRGKQMNPNQRLSTPKTTATKLR